MTLRDQANQATIREAASIVGCNRNLLWTVIRRGVVPVVGKTRVPRAKKPAKLVDLADVEAWRDAIKQRPWYIDSCGDRSDEEIARMRGVKVASVRRARERRKRRQG